MTTDSTTRIAKKQIAKKRKTTVKKITKASGKGTAKKAAKRAKKAAKRAKRTCSMCDETADLHATLKRRASNGVLDRPAGGGKLRFYCDSCFVGALDAHSRSEARGVLTDDQRLIFTEQGGMFGPLETTGDIKSALADAPDAAAKALIKKRAIPMPRIVDACTRQGEGGLKALNQYINLYGNLCQNVGTKMALAACKRDKGEEISSLKQANQVRSAEAKELQDQNSEMRSYAGRLLCVGKKKMQYQQ
jgi:hypothetical protein